MSEQIISREERFILKAYRAFNEQMKARARRDFEAMIEEQEEKEDNKAIKERCNEPTVPAAEVYKKLGLK